MWSKLILAALGLVVAGLLEAVVVTKRQVERRTTDLVDGLLGAPSLSERTYQTTDLDGLPVPVRRYLRRVLRDGQPYVRALRMEQRGTFRAGDATAAWRPFTATQHVTVQPPGFVWDARIQMMAGLPVRVLDAYHDGNGVLEARLGGVLPVMAGAPGPDLDEGELLRYLAEAPLYPTALLPEMGVTWTPIDGRSARATLTDRGTTATLVFHFDDNDEVARVEGRRSFTKADGTAEERPWRGYWRDYAERNGMWVPTRGEVAWVHPEAGEVSYWRGQLWALDVVQLYPSGNRARGLYPTVLDRFAIFGTPVYAPCAGQVEAVENTLPDLVPPARDTTNKAGNYVLLRCGPEAYVLLAHLKQGSVPVDPGGSVSTGVRLGAIGNSGNSWEPHLHINAQRGPGDTTILDADPRPMTFAGGFPVRNDVVRRYPK